MSQFKGESIWSKTWGSRLASKEPLYFRTQQQAASPLLSCPSQQERSHDWGQTHRASPSLRRWTEKSAVFVPVPCPAIETGMEQKATFQTHNSLPVCSSDEQHPGGDPHERPLWCCHIRSEHTTQLPLTLTLNTSAHACAWGLAQKPLHGSGSIPFRHRFIRRRCSLKVDGNGTTRFFFLILLIFFIYFFPWLEENDSSSSRTSGALGIISGERGGERAERVDSWVPPPFFWDRQTSSNLPTHSLACFCTVIGKHSQGSRMRKSECAWVDFEEYKSAEVFIQAAILGVYLLPFIYSGLGDEWGRGINHSARC